MDTTELLVYSLQKLHNVFVYHTLEVSDKIKAQDKG